MYIYILIITRVHLYKMDSSVCLHHPSLFLCLGIYLLLPHERRRRWTGNSSVEIGIGIEKRLQSRRRWTAPIFRRRTRTRPVVRLSGSLLPPPCSSSSSSASALSSLATTTGTSSGPSAGHAPTPRPIPSSLPRNLNPPAT